MTGPYDAGYSACPCFWGRRPGSYVAAIMEFVGPLAGRRVLDLGCGEGKNAAFLASYGAIVRAVDSSKLALANARAAWPDASGVAWELGNAATIELPASAFDVVIAYGLLHCLGSHAEVRLVVKKLQSSTLEGGVNVVCSFNDRAQDLSAHPGFSPTLIPHDAYLELYDGWEILRESDADLEETHPHNGIAHSHSLTRLIARKPMP